MMRLLVVGLALVLAGQALADEKSEKPDPKKAVLTAFEKVNYDKAIEKAKKEKKVVMIDFYADWCGPCKQLDQKTFADEKVQKLPKDKTIAIKINTDDEAKLVAKYKVNAIPCLVFLDGDGKEVGRIVGFREADKFIEEAAKIAK